MLSIKLSNGSTVSVTIDLDNRAVRIHQTPVPGATLSESVGAVAIPLTDLKRTVESVSELVKVFKS